MLTNVDLETAVELVRQDTSPLGAEEVALSDALDRVLAEDVVAPLDQPAFPRSPLDGYALIAADTEGASEATPVRLRVAGKLYAGDWADFTVHRGEAVRLMTGSVIPKPCDCVIRQEDTDGGEVTVTLYQSLRQWENYCFKGEDYKRGTVLLRAFRRIDPAIAAVLASAGIATVRVVKMPRVSILSTGSELLAPGERYADGKIYESSAYYMDARLRHLGARLLERTIVRDEEEPIAAHLRSAVAQSDLVITTGGVSVGEKDLLPDILTRMNADRVFHRMKMKPSSPAMFSVLDGVKVLSLSGNPFAAIAGFELLACPILSALTRDESLLPRIEYGVLKSGFRKKSNSRRFIRGSFDGTRVTLPETHDNGQIFSMIGCNCFADIPAGSDALHEGDRVKVVVLAI
jgi:molybdopterin molybdotransferase